MSATQLGQELRATQEDGPNHGCNSGKDICVWQDARTKQDSNIDYIARAERCERDEHQRGRKNSHKVTRITREPYTIAAGLSFSGDALSKSSRRNESSSSFYLPDSQGTSGGVVRRQSGGLTLLSTSPQHHSLQTDANADTFSPRIRDITNASRNLRLEFLHNDSSPLPSGKADIVRNLTSYTIETLTTAGTHCELVRHRKVSASHTLRWDQKVRRLDSSARHPSWPQRYPGNTTKALRNIQSAATRASDVHLQTLAAADTEEDVVDTILNALQRHLVAQDKLGHSHDNTLGANVREQEEAVTELGEAADILKECLDSLTGQRDSEMGSQNSLTGWGDNETVSQDSHTQRKDSQGSLVVPRHSHSKATEGPAEHSDTEIACDDSLTGPLHARTVPADSLTSPGETVGDLEDVDSRPGNAGEWELDLLDLLRCASVPGGDGKLELLNPDGTLPDVDIPRNGTLAFCMGNQKVKGYPLTFQNPHQTRLLAREAPETIRSWFELSGIYIGDMAQTPAERLLVMRLCYTWKDCFVGKLEDIRTTSLIEHGIPLVEGAKPSRMGQRRYGRAQQDFAKVIFPRMEKSGLIYRGDSEWAAPTLFVPKPSPASTTTAPMTGSQPEKIFRVVHDYRDINANTVKTSYPCHDLETDIDSIYCGRPGVFSQADASNGFWAIGIKKEDQHKTAFAGPNGMYVYRNMAQGLTGSPRTYARFGDLVFGHLSLPDVELNSILGYVEELKTSLFIYVDDHNMASETFTEHFNFLHQHYFPRIAWAPIGLSAAKTKLFMSEITSVGFTLSSGNVRPALKHRDKFAKIGEHFLSFPPRRWEDVEALILLTPFLRKFIPGRADLVRRIKEVFFEFEHKQTSTGKRSVQTRQTRRDTFRWSDEAARALQEICRSIQNNATHGARSNTQFHLATDASEGGTGAVLFQMENTPAGTDVTDANFDKVRVIMWMSFRLSDTEKRYSMPHKEMLAIVRAIKECEWLISCSEHALKVYTDHKGVVDSMANLSEVHGKVSRWIDILGEHNLEFIHRRNNTKVMGIADGMSRLPAALRDPGCLIKRRLAWEVGSADVKTSRQHPTPAEGEPTSCLHASLVVQPTILLPGGERPPSKILTEVETALEKFLTSSWYGDTVTAILYGREKLSPSQRKLQLRKSLRYRIVDKVLYYLENDESLAECVLPEKVPRTLQLAHDACGHFAVAITLQHLRGSRYWPTRTTDVEKYCRTCLVCQQTAPRLPRHTPRATLVLQPWRMVAMDFLGPINPPTRDGKRFVLLAVDYFTRFLCAKALKEATAELVVETWESDWGSIFGWPLYTYSDNGSHFKNVLCEAAAAKHGTTMIFGPVSHPQSTGLVERAVRLLKAQLMKWAVERYGGELGDWDKALPHLVVALNSRHVQTLGSSPAKAMFGFEPFSKHHGVDPVEIDWEQLEELEHTARALNLAAQDVLDEHRDMVACQATWRHEMAMARPARYVETYMPGDWVWEKQDKANKLHTKFHKSWGNLSAIVDRVTEVTYLTRSLGKEGVVRKVHVDDLKRYHTRPEHLMPTRLNDWDMAPWCPGESGVAELEDEE